MAIRIGEGPDVSLTGKTGFQLVNFGEDLFIFIYLFIYLFILKITSFWREKPTQSTQRSIKIWVKIV